MNPKTIIGGVIAVALMASGSIFLVNAISGSENAICGENGFANEYDPDKGVCKPTGNYAKSLTMVVGNTANTPAPSIEKDSDLYRYVKNSIASGAKIKMISAATDLSVMPISYEITNKDNEAKGFVEAVDSAMDGIIAQLQTPATSDGATYYEAIMKAGRDANTSAQSNNEESQSGSADRATVIVLGSGLSDGGLMNFPRDELLYKSSSEILGEMQQANQLANTLNGVTIRWSGIGQTMQPQADLPVKEQEDLRTIYYDVLMAKGAGKVVFYDNALPKSTLNNNYKVVPTPIDSIMIFTNEDLEFIGNTDQFKDESAARAALNKAVQKANSKPSSKIIITGFMAAGQCNTDVDKSLALKRAEAVKEILKNDIAESRMQTVNGGIPEGDECVGNDWKNELAENKRKVIIEFQ